MKYITTIVLTILAFNVYSQIECGKYTAWLDIYWVGHTQIFIELKPDNTYKFSYLDDCDGAESEGTYTLNDTILKMKPKQIPDTIVIADTTYYSSIFDHKKCIRIEELFGTGMKDVKVEFYQNGLSSTAPTDSTGISAYTGSKPDSIVFYIKSKRLSIVPKAECIEVSMNLNNYDLLYQINGKDYFIIKDNQILLEYFCEEHKMKHIIPFKKIK